MKRDDPSQEQQAIFLAAQVQRMEEARDTTSRMKSDASVGSASRVTPRRRDIGAAVGSAAVRATHKMCLEAGGHGSAARTSYLMGKP